jgi:GDPmannose 4,6-dehydratase
MKKALITGVTGQDGSYLSKLLLEKGYKVYGATRRTSTDNKWRLRYLGVEDAIEFVYLDLVDTASIHRAILETQPDELYNLAAMSFVGASFEAPVDTAEVDGMSVIRILEWLRQLKPDCKFYQASTSEMFGNSNRPEKGYSEKTRLEPRSPYGVAKTFAYYATINYREAYNMFSVNGMLFNHESVLRGSEFVTKKIVSHLVKYKFGKETNPLKLGNLEAKRDWGYAPEFVEGMWRIMQLEKPSDYVLGTGEVLSVDEFLKRTLEKLEISFEKSGEGLDTKFVDTKTGKVIVETDPAFYRPAEVDFLQADITKSKEEFGWDPKYKGLKLVDALVEDEIKMQ